MRIIVDFCENTTLHGFAYVVSAPRLLERFFWGLVIAAFVSYGWTTVFKAVVDWGENPTVTVYVELKCQGELIATL